MKPFYIILLILWFILGYFLVKNNVCQNDSKAQLVEESMSASEIADNCKSTLVFKDGEFKVVVDDNFKFQRSQINYHNLTPEFEESMLRVVQHLDENSNRKMKIKGYYLPSEDNQTDYENLGLARANSVKTYFLTLGINSSQLLTSSKLSDEICYESDVLKKGIVVAFGQ